MIITSVITTSNSEFFLDTIKSNIRSLCSYSHVIVVDDASTDNTVPFLNNLSKHLPFRLILKQSPLGVSHSRNLGIDSAETKFITFIDHDDIIDPIFFRQSSSYLNSFPNSQLLVCSYTTSYISSSTPVLDTLNLEPAVLNSQEFKTQLHYFNNPSTRRLIYHVFLSAWGKFFDMDLLRQHNLYFPENLSKFEDMLFGITYYNYISEFHLLDSPFYIYNQSRSSPSGLSNNFKISEWLAYSRFLHDELQKLSPFEPIHIQFVTISLFGTIIRELNSCSFKEIAKIKSLILEYFPDFAKLARLHHRPAGANFVLTILLKSSNFYLIWLFLLFLKCNKPPVYRPPFWCLS